MYQITRREKLSETTFLWEVFAPDVARAARPGQFVMIRLDELGERIPLTVADFDPRRGTITLVIQAVGKTTVQMMNAYPEGGWFRDFVGPLGVESHIESQLAETEHVVLVGGGLGVAPIFPQLRAYKEAGARVTGIIGFRSRSLVFWEDRFRPFCDELIVCTDDGSYGRPGLVTAALEEVITSDPSPTRAVAIGPLPMMRACAEVTRPRGVPTWVSLNAIMVDGTGMCGSCRVSVGGEIKFACVDGPDFDAHAVDFPELMARQKRFAPLEGQASEEYGHVCNLETQLIVEGRRNYKKIRELPPKARPMPERDAGERSRNFEEVNLGYSMVDALAEAERCIQCKRPTCVSGCPVGIDIPRFIRHLLVRDLPAALDAIHESNLFPSICGRVCPQERQCEAQCILRKKMEPVAIGRLERFIGDNAPLPSVRPPIAASERKKVAIVGSGPAGLAAAGDLARGGHDVVVYEALHVVGGVLRYGIPAFRLPRETIAREVKALEGLGVRFEVNKVIGRTFTLPQLLGEMGFSAAFVGTGAGYPVFLGLPGESAGQVYSANEFLSRVNLMGGDRFPFEDTPVRLGDRVAVIGAGNTAMDCLRVSRRMGANEVHCVYRRTEAEAPARIEELRHAREEGIELHFLRSPLAINVDDQGNITGLRCQVMKLGEPDASGRRRPIPVAGEEQLIECDTVIYALGTRANPIIGRATPDLALNERGYIQADPVTQASNLPGVFAGGDIVTGGATVILALGAGRRAAKGIDRWLQTGTWPPLLAEQGPLAPSGAICPKCHAPQEDGEAYVCCADQALVWRCERCHKVYEGFAFPFGLCPSCGGTLQRDSAQAAGSDVARQAIRRAFEIELGGVALYTRGEDATDDPSLSELFGRLAQMERHHLEILSKRYHVEPPTLDDVGIGPGELAVYVGVELTELVRADGTEDKGLALLELAQRLEQRARDFFAKEARALEVGSPEWRLYRELEAEEWEHVAMIATELERYREGLRGTL